MFVLCINAAAFVYTGTRIMADEESHIIFSRSLLEDIGNEISMEQGEYILSEDGYQKLMGSSFIWAMMLNAEGDVVWSYDLPEEIPLHYGLNDVAVFSKWYLKDYPVYVWKNEDALMVYGCAKDSIARISTIYDMETIRELPRNLAGFLILNLFLILFLALLFGYRFYRSLKPIASGIEALSKREITTLPEKGITDELASRLNEVSVLLRSQDEKLQQRDNARTNWIAGVSHDIRTPLALITGYADELANNSTLDEATRQKANRIIRQSLYIKQLISDLNLTSKLEYQAQPLKRQNFFPAKLLRECVAEYYNQGLSQTYEIEVKIEPEVEKIQLYGDTGLLLRALHNLIGNSIRHNPAGCTLVIRLMCMAEGVMYQFVDNGPGIPEKVVDALSGNLSEEAQVHVMGLRIVKQIVEAHGGRMLLVKRESGTSDVTIQLVQTQ